jgi:hypothetical protein
MMGADVDALCGPKGSRSSCSNRSGSARPTRLWSRRRSPSSPRPARPTRTSRGPARAPGTHSPRGRPGSPTNMVNTTRPTRTPSAPSTTARHAYIVSTNGGQQARGCSPAPTGGRLAGGRRHNHCQRFVGTEVWEEGAVIRRYAYCRSGSARGCWCHAADCRTDARPYQPAGEIMSIYRPDGWSPGPGDVHRRVNSVVDRLVLST